VAKAELKDRGATALPCHKVQRMTVTLERVSSRLPHGFEDLQADALADGHRHLMRLATELEQSPTMFHAIFAGDVEGRLAGIGAMTDEPALTLGSAWRLRRLYVHRNFRRLGVARSIVMALLQEASGNVSTVTVHAGNDGASRFWEAIGFHPVAGKAWSHERPVSGAISRA
jgi:GNAT superfamily N-acetyltransferase